MSKTYLKDSETRSGVEPVFGYVGDFVRHTANAGASPGPNLSATPRWSQTPFRNDGGGQAAAESQSRVYQPSPLQNPAYPDNQKAIALQLAKQESRLKFQEDKMTAQETQIRLLTSLLEALRGTLDEVKDSIQDLRLRSRGDLKHDDVIGNLESVLAGLTSTRSSGREIENLRAENAAMKQRLEELAAGLLPTSNASHLAHPAPLLGKRKRDGAMGENQRPGPDRRRGHYGSRQDAPFTIQLPTPQSSILSERHSTDMSASSINLTPDGQLEHSRSLFQSHEASSEGDGYHVDELPPRPAESDSQGHAHDQIPSSSGLGASTAQQSDDGRDRHAPLHDDAGQPADTDDQTQWGVGDMEASGSHLSTMNNVEFSDEDQVDTFDTHEDHLEVDDPHLPPPLDQPSDADVSHDSAPSKRPRTRYTEASSMATDSTIDGRYGAPEPGPFPRVLTRKLVPDPFDVLTPVGVEEAMARKKAHQKKPQVQYMTKMLNAELVELGLEEWISRDKQGNNEYRQAVAEARERQRERNKAAKLASFGIGVPATPTDHEPASDPTSLTPLDQARQEATEGLLDSGDGQEAGHGTTGAAACEVLVESKAARRVGRPRRSTKVAVKIPPKETDEWRAGSKLVETPSPAVGSRVTRQKQRDEEIRRQDQLAKEAMEMLD